MSKDKGNRPTPATKSEVDPGVVEALLEPSKRTLDLRAHIVLLEKRIIELEAILKKTPVLHIVQ